MANEVETKQPQQDQSSALRELLMLIAKNPELADRITITIKPAKLAQGTDKK